MKKNKKRLRENLRAKQAKKRKIRENKKDLLSVRRLDSENQENSDFIKQAFLGEGQEEITEDLINELIEKGFAEEYLRQLKEGGYRYSRPRNTFFSPPEIG